MNEREIKFYNGKMLQHLPLTLGAVSWWWRIITSLDFSALIHEDELHSAVEYAKNFYKKQIEMDDDLTDRQKEIFKKACDFDLSNAEQMAKQYELEEVKPHVYSYKGPCSEHIPIPHWVQYIFEKKKHSRHSLLRNNKFRI